MLWLRSFNGECTIDNLLQLDKPMLLEITVNCVTFYAIYVTTVHTYVSYLCSDFKKQLLLKINFRIMIKSIILASGIFFLMATGSMAQHVNIGIKTGLNFYNLNGNHIPNPDFIPGFHVGMLGHIHLTDRFGLQPEFTYSLQGAKSGGTRYNLGYLNLPVLFQYMFNNGFRLQAGPQLGFLVHANSKLNNNSLDEKNNFKSVEVGMGIGVSYVHSPTGFGADLRFNRGLTDISNINSFSATNQGIQLGVFYLFKHRS